MKLLSLSTLKPKKLNESGFDHVMLIVVFVVLFALVGTWFLIHSLAATQYYQLKMGVAGKSMNLCLDDSSTGPRIISWTCNGSDTYQQWQEVASGSNFMIKNNKTGQCVNDPGAAVGTGPSNRVYATSHACDNSTGVVWRNYGGALLNVKSRVTWKHSGKTTTTNGCLNDPASSTSTTQLIVYPCDGPGVTTFSMVAVNSGGSGGGGSSSACPGGYHASASDAKKIAQCQLKSYGWSDQYSCLDNIYSRESSWSWSAANASGAYGIPQADPGSKMASAGSDWHDNAATQIKWGLSYIKSVYGTPCKAWSFWQGHHYYIEYTSPSGVKTQV